MKYIKLVLLFIVFHNQLFSTPEITDSESKKIFMKASFSYLELLNIGVNIQHSSYFIEIGINPFLMGANTMIAYRFFKSKSIDIYAGSGVGANVLSSTAYIFSGIGSRLKLNENHYIFYEAAIGLVNDPVYDNNTYLTVPTFRLGYQMPLLD